MPQTAKRRLDIESNTIVGVLDTGEWLNVPLFDKKLKKKGGGGIFIFLKKSMLFCVQEFMSMLPASTMKVTALSQQNGRENVSREPTSRAATSISFLFFPVNDVDHEEQKYANNKMKCNSPLV
jgi:hypothetical protein